MYNVEGKWERGCFNKGRDNEGQSINNYWAQREVGKKKHEHRHAHVYVMAVTS